MVIPTFPGSVKKHPVTPKRGDSQGADEARSSTVEKWLLTCEKMKFICFVQTERSVFIQLQSAELTNFLGFQVRWETSRSIRFPKGLLEGLTGRAWLDSSAGIQQSSPEQTDVDHRKRSK